MIEILGAALTPISDKEGLEALLSDGFRSVWQERHRGLREPSARCASLVGILLLQAAGVVGKLSYDRLGRPYLLDAPVDFNVTHTDGYVFCAIERCDAENSFDTPRVGIDAEEMTSRNNPRRADMASRWFSADEQRLFFADPTEECFLRLWTRKESLIKWTGEGMRSLAESDTLNAERTHGVRFQDYREGSALISLCHRVGTSPPQNIRIFSIDELSRLCEKSKTSLQ